MTDIHLIFWAGSARKESFNKKLAFYASVAASGVPGVKAQFIDLADYPAPLYHGDEEAQGAYPEKMKQLKEIFQQADGFFLSSPEYNGFFPPLLKNVTDWLTRPVAGTVQNAFAGKTAALAGASPGGLGGLRGLPHLRILYSGIGVDVISEQYALGNAGQAFDAEGRLIDTGQANAVNGVVNALIAKTRKLKAA